MRTLWGESQHVKTLAPGIELVDTSSHGGIVLDAAHQARIPASIVPFGGDRRYWEEDCDIAVPLLLFAEEIGEPGTRAREFLEGYKPEWVKAIGST